MFKKVLLASVLSLSGAAALSVAIPAGATTPTDAVNSGAQTQVLVQPQVDVQNYYVNYFSTSATCDARGRAILYGPPGTKIPGVVDYYCYKRSGDSKWSMKLYYL